MSVRVKLAGGSSWTPHVRTHDELRARPHIAKHNRSGMWAVYSMVGKQSRMRCTLHPTLAEAYAQASRIYHYILRTQRYERALHT